ncbi:MAG: fibrobacter succinogenes major paralogous domain-containing protein [Bacteroidales bacterium]|nr:fibrobacter succinogenes major paralogous domain-containing protein [Bacteroidales bacterium]
MKKITLILILIASFATQSFAHCPIPQWCPDAPLHQTLCPGDTIETIEFPSVIAKTLIITWWMNETRTNFRPTPPPGITVSGDASTPLGEREYAWPVSIKGAPTAPGTHHYTVSNTCGVELLHGSITLNALPTIGRVTPTTGQATPQNIPFTSNLTLTAQPTGVPPITIQWFSNTTTSTTGGTNLGVANGAQTDTFTPPTSATVNLSGVYYYAVATDGCDRTVTTNNTSGKHIVVPASIGVPGDLSLCTGTNYVPDIGVVSWQGSTDIETYSRTISGNGITQVWSGVVTTSNCNSRTSFTADNTVTDCRNATNGFDGDYFNFCFVISYQNQLCPGDWRVPTRQDFINLDIALGGTGYTRWTGNPATVPVPGGETIDQQLAWYIGTTGTGTVAVNNGGIWGGSRFTAQAANLVFEGSLYWSSSQNSNLDGLLLDLGVPHVNPQSQGTKGHGGALRCVR